MREIVSAVVIDDEADDIVGISAALAKKEIFTIPIHYKGSSKAQEAYDACKVASSVKSRVIITDIQMNNPRQPATKTDLGNVAGCLENAVKGLSGYYIILVWTENTRDFNKLKKYVLKHFEKENIEGPLHFGKISKDKCKPGGEYDSDIIFKKIKGYLRKNKQLQALLYWERCVHYASVDSVGALIKTAKASRSSVPSILNELASGVAGKNLSEHESVAINEALSYLLKDKVSISSINKGYKNVWKAALPDNIPKPRDDSKFYLNTLLHFDKNPSKKIICPGDLWLLEKEKKFFKLFFSKDIEYQIDRFKDGLLTYKPSKSIKGEPTINCADPKKSAKESMKLIAIEISPVCDFSNNKKALKTFVLGALLPKDSIKKQIQISEADSIIDCPIFYDDGPQYLILSAKYIVSFSEETFSKKVTKTSKKLRVRESLLQSWIHTISSYNSRIGTV